MAKNIEQKFSVDLSGVVDNSIAAVKAIRKSEQIRKEAEFQRAIANGLSYEEQVALRKKQLEDEKRSSVADPGYIAELEKSISDTMKLNRFNKYRTKYATTLGELSAGKINEEDYLSILETQLSGVEDAELRLEIQGDITAAHAKVKTYKDTILSNQVKKAKYDGTESALNEALARVNVARAEALINDNADEVTAYDETLSALNSQLSSVRIQNSITDFQVKSATRGTNPVEKLNYINNEIQRADPNVAIKIDDRTFTSAQQFWTLERDSFFAGNSQVFGNFFEELKTDVENYIGTESVKFGYPTQVVLDSALSTFDGLRAKPEMIPFLSRLDITQASVMSKSVDTLAKTIISVGTNNLTFKDADIQLNNIQTKYGVDVQGYRLQLDEQLRNLARGGVIEQSEARKLAPDVNVPLPKVDKVASVAPTAPGATAPTAPSDKRQVQKGDTLIGISKETGVPLSKLLELNPQFKERPDLILPGQTVNLPGKPPEAPAEKSPATSSSTPAPAPVVATPSPTPIQNPAPAPTSLPANPAVTPKPPVTPTTPSGYTGASIVDYLKFQNQDSSFASRKKLAAEKGMVDYRGDAKQNEELLKLLRG